MGKKKEELTAKQQRFVEEYTVDFNGTQAAIRAGYSEKTANEQAARLLAKASVQNVISESQKTLAEKTEITRERIVEEYAKIAFSDMRKFSKWGPGGVVLIASDKLDDDSAACVAEVSQTVTEAGGSIKFKLHDKKGALDSLAKILGYSEPITLNHQGHIDVSSQITITDILGAEPVKAISHISGALADIARTQEETSSGGDS